MRNASQRQAIISTIRLRSVSVSMILAIVLLQASVVLAATHYEALHNFAGGGKDGIGPASTLIFDPVGNLYGTTSGGTLRKQGTIFKLTPNSKGGWTESVIHSFSGNGGANPMGGLTFDGNGNLYGTTQSGGSHSSGTVFELRPVAGGSWKYKTLHSFIGTHDGEGPVCTLVFDSAGNLYGTTNVGGPRGYGTVFELTPSSSGRWTETTIYSFSGGSDGGQPIGGLIFDAKGNLYGTGSDGGDLIHCVHGCGVVFSLTLQSGGEWHESVLYSFKGERDGIEPAAALTLGRDGNLYGTTGSGGAYNYGIVFKLTASSGGEWVESVLKTFVGGRYGAGPYAQMIFDQQGSLYGTTISGGGSSNCEGGCGTAFRLTPSFAGKWTTSVLHRFKGKDGANPEGGIIFDQLGKVYGTTSGGGTHGFGVVFEVSAN